LGGKFRTREPSRVFHKHQRTSQKKKLALRKKQVFKSFRKLENQGSIPESNFFSQPHRVVSVNTQVDNRQKVLGYSNTPQQALSNTFSSLYFCALHGFA
jgi:hypothetical protein